LLSLDKDDPKTLREKRLKQLKYRKPSEYKVKMDMKNYISSKTLFDIYGDSTFLYTIVSIRS